MIPEEIKAFIEWLDHPKCVFNHYYNGTEPERPKIGYEKSGKIYTIDQVYQFYLNQK